MVDTEYQYTAPGVRSDKYLTINITIPNEQIRSTCKTPSKQTCFTMNTSSLLSHAHRLYYTDYSPSQIANGKILETLEINTHVSFIKKKS